MAMNPPIPFPGDHKTWQVCYSVLDEMDGTYIAGDKIWKNKNVTYSQDAKEYETRRWVSEKIKRSYLFLQRIMIIHMIGLDEALNDHTDAHWKNYYSI